MRRIILVLSLVLGFVLEAQAQNVVLDESLQASMSGARGGGRFANGGWQVTGKNDFLLWHIPTLRAGAVEFSVRGLRPQDNRPEGLDKNELFHMYDSSFRSADTTYDGYRNNPYKHFIRKSNPLNGPKTDSLELLLQIGVNYVEPDTNVLSWDPNTTYVFREEWAPDGTGNTVVHTYRDGQRLLTMSKPGDWAPATHAIRIGASTRLGYPDFGAPLEAVFSNVRVWDAPNGRPPGGPNPTPTPTPTPGPGGGIARQGPVRVVGYSLQDDGGPFLGLGCSYMTALLRCKNDRARFRSDLAYLKSKGIDNYRMLSMVGWYEAWDGLEIAPIAFQSRRGKNVPAWHDYWQQLRDCIDIGYDDYGLRAEITIFADAQLMPNRPDRIAHMDRMLADVIRGREHKIVHLEVGNEAWQNGFGHATGEQDLRDFARHLADRTNVPIAITSNHGSVAEMERIYRHSAADLTTWHLSRDKLSHGWGAVIDAWDHATLPNFPPVSSNEPIGPGSSVNSENDPSKLVLAAAFAYASKCPQFVFHSSAGVFGHQRFEDMPGLPEIGNVVRLLPPDLASWQRYDARDAASPFTVYAGGQGNRYWPENGAGDGCVKAIGGRKGNEWVFIPVGVRGSLELEARHPFTFRVYDPLTGQTVFDGSKNPGDRLTLPAGPGGYLITTYVPPTPQPTPTPTPTPGPTPTPTPTPSPGPGPTPTTGPGGGLRGEYSWRQLFFSTRRVTRTDAIIDFNWGGGSPGNGVPRDKFNVKWTGLIEPAFTETYNVIATSDDGVRVWIDGRIVVDDWSQHGARPSVGQANLTAGHLHDIRIEYFEAGGDASITLEWESASQGREVVPTARLSPPGSAPAPSPTPSPTPTPTPTPTPNPGGTGLSAEYFQGLASPALRVHQVDAVVHFDWRGGGPHPAIAADEFVVRWSGQVEPRSTDAYTFIATTDDGVRLWVDGSLIGESWSDHGRAETVGHVFLTAGRRADIVIEYYERGGDAVAILEWASASQPREVVPQSCLHPNMAGSKPPMPPVPGTGGGAPAPSPSPSPSPAPGGGNGNGLYGSYHDARSGQAIIRRVDGAVDFDWGSGTPDGAVPVDGFSIVWTGEVDPVFSEHYTFSTIADDGVRLWVDGQLLIDDWNDHGAEERSGSIGLQAGRRVPIRLEYYENGGGAVVKLLWASGSQGREIVPTSRLHAAMSSQGPQPSPTPQPAPAPRQAGSGLKAEYFSDASFGRLAEVKVDPVVDFRWHDHAPSHYLPADGFTVRWTGWVEPAHTETYTFFTQADDGIRLWVNGVLLVNNWWDHGIEEHSGRIDLQAGQRAEIRIEYYENTGGAGASLLWESSSQGKEVVPRDRLHPAP